MANYLEMVTSRPREWLRPWMGPAPAILLIGLAGGCDCFKSSGSGTTSTSSSSKASTAAAAPPVTEIEIVPWQVVVGPNTGSETTFELEARLWSGLPTDRRSITEAQGYTLTWAIDPVTPQWLTLDSQRGFRAIFKVPAGLTPTGSVNVRVTAGSKTSLPAEISVAATTVPGQDLVTAAYTAAIPPAAVTVNGVRNAIGGSCDVTLEAFVTRSMVGKLVAPCVAPNAGWEAAVLAVDHRSVFDKAIPSGWTPPDNTVHTGPKQGGLRTLPLALRVMVGNSDLGAPDPVLQQEVLDVAVKDILGANAILAESRSGIQLTIEQSDKVAVNDDVEIGDCIDGDGKTALKDEGGLLNVYYVNDLYTYRGRACDRHEEREQDVIYVGWNQHSATTLIHEVGHVLGLTLPIQGHTDDIKGFDRSNVMTGGDYDYDPGGRRRLTVGQVFRMNADSASWLNWAYNPPDGNPAHLVRESGAPRLACQCGAADPTGQCPRLGDDAARPSGRVNGINDWDCFDQLMLDVPSSESPVGVIAGRRWRTPPATCRTDLPGKTEVHWSATYVRFDNLTRPGGCESWAAIFFKTLGVVFLHLEESKFPLTQAADLLVVNDPDPIPSRVDIRVHVYYPMALKNLVPVDFQHASETFGELNRSGILLVLDDKGGVTCPSTKPVHPEINLCYSAAGSDEGTLMEPRRIRVMGGRTATTVSHFIGRALGLFPILTGVAPLPGNIMHTSPAKRDKNLTLSQVFQINAALNPLLCNPSPCPTLSPHVAP